MGHTERLCDVPLCTPAAHRRNLNCNEGAPLSDAHAHARPLISFSLSLLSPPTWAFLNTQNRKTAESTVRSWSKGNKRGFSALGYAE